MSAFDSIIGYEGVKNELYQVIDIFKNKKKYEDMGAKLPKGLIIFGEPGMGKTMLAEALIKESNTDAFIIKNTKSQDELIKEINETFEKAGELDNCIVFLDDLDKFSEADGEKCDSRVFVAIQANIDSVKDKNVLVICTINNIRKLPDSLTRHGRFDRKIHLDIPTDDDACKIIEFYLKSKKIKDNLNFEDVSKMICYTSCANLETVLNEAAILAAYQGKSAIDIDDISKAYVKDYYNVPDFDFECSQEEIDKTALHEAGHAVVAEALKEGSVGFITIQAMDRDRMSGFTHICYDFKRRPENVLVGLGGKVACEQFYEGRCASGCISDLNKVIRLLKGGICGSGTQGVANITLSDEVSTSTEAVIKAEIERYLFMVRDILLKNKDFLLKLAKELATKKSLLYSDIKRIKESVTLVPYVA